MQERGAAPPLTSHTHHDSGARRLVVTLSVAAVVVAVDQVTKAWAVGRLSQGPLHIVGKLDFELGYNTGSSFSLAQGWGTVLAGLAIVFVVGLVVLARRAGSTAMAAALGLVIGGALGNLVDRAARGHVVDFVALHFWPTFNVADSCIVVGGIWAAILLWRTPAPATGGTRAEGDALERSSEDRREGP